MPAYKILKTAFVTPLPKSGSLKLPSTARHLETFEPFSWTNTEGVLINEVISPFTVMS